LLVITLQTVPNISFKYFIYPIFYLTTLLVAHIIWPPRIGRFAIGTSVNTWKWPWPNLRFYPGICSQKLKKTRNSEKTSVSIRFSAIRITTI